MQMTITEAIEQATKFTEGETFHAGSTGWKTVMARLLEEVKTLIVEISEAKKTGGYTCHVCGALRSECEIMKRTSDNVALRAAEIAGSQDAIGKTPAQVSTAILREFGLDIPCHCPACRIAEETNEPQGPLPAAILAGEIDDAAEKLAELAKEIDIYNGLKHEGAIRAIGTFKTFLVLFAKHLRTETIEVKFEESIK